MASRIGRWAMINTAMIAAQIPAIIRGWAAFKRYREAAKMQRIAKRLEAVQHQADLLNYELRELASGGVRPENKSKRK